MRIRKRAVPLPLSFRPPVPFSDRLVQLSADSPPPSDDLLIACDHAAASRSPVPVEVKGYGDEKNKEKREDYNRTGNYQSDTGTVSDIGAVLPPTPSNLTEAAAADDRWCEGDKAVPFKKRKVRLEFEMSNTGETKMKSKTNKKCPHDHDTSDSDDNDDDRREKKKKKRKNKKGKTTLGAKRSGKDGRILMEGSRCSRVNGRGWRCLQPTLVGYSLCEHHLGKGRLRSISAVRLRAHEKVLSRGAAPASSTPPRASEAKISCSQEDYSKAGAGGKKKIRKVGVVKARSLSSLLCQPDTKVVQPAA